MVMKLLHFRDRDSILQAARLAESLEIEGNRVMLFPDYTIAVQQQRATFVNVKHKLRDLGLKYALLFPARLRVILDNKSYFFTEPSDVWNWLEQKVDGAGPPAGGENRWSVVPKKRKKHPQRGKRTARKSKKPTMVPDL